MKHRQTLWIPAWTLLVALPFLLVAGTAAQGLTFTKSLAAGQSPTVAPGEPVVFEIEMINEGDALTNWPLKDILDGCFEPITCDDVSCVGGISCGLCQEIPDVNVNGFDHNSIDLAAAGQPDDRVTLTVNATAGGASGECCNGAITLDPLGGLLFDQECVSIEGGPQVEFSALH